MAWLIILALLLALLAYLLLMPLVLTGDTATGELKIRAGHLAWARLEEDPDELVHLRLHVPFANFYWRPTDLERIRSRKRKKPRTKRIGTRKQVNWFRVLRSFRVRHFNWDLDTGDPVWNAKLYPLAYMLEQQGVGVRVNFCKQNRLALRITNRPLRLLKSFVNP